jgi:predicted RNA-binding protein YlxR (DUF448 family)
VKSIRTCVGCRAQAPQDELTRVVRVGADLVIDSERRLAGRGAYLHGRRECLDRFGGSKGRVRSLRWAPSLEAKRRVATELLHRSETSR